MTMGRGEWLLVIYHKKQLYNLKKFFHTKGQKSIIHSAVIQNPTNNTKLNLGDQTYTDIPVNSNPQINKLEQWKWGELHVRITTGTKKQIASNKLLRMCNLYPETWGLITDVQDEVIDTRNYRKCVFKDPSLMNDKYWKCRTQPILLLWTDYIHWCNQIVKINYMKNCHSKTNLFKILVFVFTNTYHNL